ncbi:MAG: prepilin-type N-terminal cleavage/methylation domain-containing protein [Acidimicrobiales bacterium]
MKSRLKSYLSVDTEARGDDGFTLIELLIVVLILGILAAIVAFAVGAFTSTSAVAACNTDAKTVESAVAAYEATNTGQIPTSADLTSTAKGGPYIHNWPSNSSYYTVGLSSDTVTVGLNVTDAAAKAPHSYTTTTYPFGTHAVPYDTWTWGTGTNGPTGATTPYAASLNVCAGA